MKALYRSCFTENIISSAVPELWNDLESHISPDARRQLVCEATRFLGYQWPPIPAALYMDFKRTGNRVRFENVYFAKRRALNSLVLGELAEGEGRFLNDIINGIYSLCEESAWQLPAHNSYLRNAPQAILPDTERPIIELFACETGALLATLSSLLGKTLNNISPQICRRIHTELMNRIITPYLTEHFWWMGEEDEPMCNWTIWCTQNILLCTAQMELTPEIRMKIIQKAAASVDYFLKDYGEDGSCDEGAMYYHHAGLCLYLTTELLNRMTGDAFLSCWKDPKIRSIADYIANVHVEGPYYLNYADCAPILDPAGAREFLFGQKIGSTALCSFAALDFHTSLSRPALHYQSEEINLSYRLLTILHEKEILDYAATHPQQIPAGNIYYPSTGIFAARTSHTLLSVKAGDNDDSHNHNDTGSVILYVNGKPVLIDVGVESYTQKTFSDKRYEIWTMQSGFHNLPSIGGRDELPGAFFHAENVRVSADGNEIRLELQHAYPAECRLKLYERHAALSSDSTVLLEDHWAFADARSKTDSNVVLNFMSYEKPSYDTPTRILSIGTLCCFEVTGAESAQIEIIPVKDERLAQTWKHELYRIRFRAQADSFKMKMLPFKQDS